MKSQVEKEIIEAIQMIKALSVKTINEGKPASHLVRAVSNLNEYFSKRDLDNCARVISEVANG